MKQTTEQSSFERFESTRFFASLNGLRAVAVLWVVVYHCRRFGPAWLSSFCEAGNLGVDVFFVISGFLITTLILREPPAPTKQRLGRFYARRALRIFPAYYLAIGLYALASPAAGPGRYELYQEFIPSLLLYYTDIKLVFHTGQFPPFGHAWSLAIEERYYLLWPWVVMFLSEKRGLQLCTFLIAAATVERFLLVSTYSGDLTHRLYFGFDTRYDTIIWGALLAYLLRNRKAFAFIECLTHPAVLLLSVSVVAIYGSYTQHTDPWRYVLIPLFSTVILSSYLLKPRMIGSGLLNSRPLSYIGQISYGIYLYNQIAVSVARRLLGGDEGWRAPVACILTAVLAVVIAGLSYRFYESLFLRFKKRFA